MKKREFLALGGAVPLMVAGCGGNGSGSAPVRLVNASVGYPSLGFMVETTQATSSDVVYGSVSPFENVQAGTVTTALTTTSSSGAITSLPTVTRTLSKESRYSLVAYGYANAPKSVLIVENTVTPDNGFAYFNVLNTSTDIGPVDVYLTAARTLSASDTPLVANIGSTAQIAQSGFASVAQNAAAGSTGTTAGAFFLTVTAAGSVTAGKPDIRYQMPVGTAGFTFANQQTYTLILSPGASGVLANAILLQQGSSGTTINLPNGSARIRAVAATATGDKIAVGTNPVVLATSASPNISDYVLVDAGAAPPVNYTSAGGTTQTITATGTMVAGNDYTLLVYLDSSSGTPKVTTQLIMDTNTRPVSSANVKVRLLNVVYTTTGTPLPLTLSVNSQTIASNVGYANASTYTEIAATSTTQSTVQVTSGFNTVLTAQTTTLVAGNIYTEVVAGEVDTDGVYTHVVGQFSAARTS